MLSFGLKFNQQTKPKMARFPLINLKLSYCKYGRVV